MRIAVLQFSHETVTFLPNDTTLDDFLYPGSPASGEALLSSDPKGYMGGFVQVAREHDGVELIGIESPLWPKTGTGSGWITTEAFETFLGRMIEQLRAQGPFDGAYLALHGAMAVRGVPRPEAEIARRGLSQRVILLGRFPLERMPSFFKAADALLVSLKRDKIFAMTIPAKVQSYLAAGVPLLGMLDGEGARVIEEAGAGLVCPSGEGAALARNIQTLAAMTPVQRAEMGARAQAYGVAEFDRTKLLGELEAKMLRAASGQS